MTCQSTQITTFIWIQQRLQSPDTHTSIKFIFCGMMMSINTRILQLAICMKFGFIKCNIPVQKRGSATNTTDFVLPTAACHHIIITSLPPPGKIIKAFHVPFIHNVASNIALKYQWKWLHEEQRYFKIERHCCFLFRSRSFSHSY